MSLPDWKREDWLRDQYWNKDKSGCQIAREQDVNSGTIWYWMDKHDIPRRDRMEECKRKTRVEWANYYTNSHGHPLWKTSNGKNNEDVMYVHRLQAVAEWGIEAVKGKDVHHKNGIPWDNRVENLKPMSPSEHSSQHAKEDHADAEYPTGNLAGGD